MNSLPLTDAQREAIAESEGTPVRLVDAETKASYVLVPATDYQRLRPMLADDPFRVHESYPLQEAAANAAGWDDSALDAYKATRRSPRRR